MCDRLKRDLEGMAEDVLEGALVNKLKEGPGNNIGCSSLELRGIWNV